MDTLQSSLAPFSRPPARRDQVSRHLSAIAARLADHGIASRLSRIGSTPVLSVEEPTAGPNPVTVSIEPNTSGGPGLSIDCTAIWTPAPGTAPQVTADTIMNVLEAVRRGMDMTS
jgi:hypothetical protein